MGDGTVVGALRAPLDLSKLVPYLEQNVDGFQGPVEPKQFGFGQSNPTYLLETPSKKYVLRRAPLGKLLSKTAHRVDREFVILNALNQYNARLPPQSARRVPVPEVYALCMDPEVAGAPFYLMEFIKGRIFTDVRMQSLPREERDACWHAAIATLAKLATVPIADLQLDKSFAADPLAKPYFPRQVKSLMKVSDAQSATPVKQNGGKPLGDIEHAQDLRHYFEKGAQVVARAETMHGASVVHGDYKIDNVIFHPTEPRVIGILDWELCTLGSPLADLGNVLMPFSFTPVTRGDLDRLGLKPDGLTNLMIGLKGLPSSETGIPQVSQLERWWVDEMNAGYKWHAAHSPSMKGKASSPAPWSYPIAGLEWVRAWMLWRLAIIAQGIAARAALGQASSATASPSRERFDFFGRMAYRAMVDGDKAEDISAKL
ncbi:hypothetical protein CcaverHIS002_0406350 [Cutaneotrichosporon cavernicola]|uniref:Aminoglycoside phosphotransferase domain-containing protein n=1 Tax=Cutaneotrichosporon cavernicola TaxID=279322 RepID=A0AA48QVY2_9TREE|nr:uncharacterized protein CcaverHIS019_0406380 [Cutaneotrichosporon cavernicola]BEI84031.1 hypothetical protein CcaverHIS002_0406350 [Cutaneotrichosporon cavernicola]BEI91818.1 hypothetical protein CcaverHIS019_0406380 [Cutaneotrichosporon cavernicola]BEI99589.1 hypothetical protein CcaverHIS631_0406320 [Cutaneotrichosporon cavernicola]BEJ07365.1 hypothetical protein CcaverHIS641_0406340 [Cutaneotrichosporon cavernicola]